MISPGSTSLQAKKEPGAYMRAGLPLPNPAGSDRLEVHRRIFAATIDLEFEFEPVALVERRQTRTLDRRDMHEGIGLAVIALDEAEAFHRVEELDRAGRLLPGELPLRAAAATIAVALPRGAAILDRHRLAVDLEIGRRNAPTAIDQREVERLAFGKRSEEHTSELQSLMRISYAVFCLKKKNRKLNKTNPTNTVYTTITIKL